MKKYIHVTKETRELLEKTFGVTSTMVWYALSFNPSRGQSDLAKRIRKAALEHRGILMADECVLENTLFDADGYIRLLVHGEVAGGSVYGLGLHADEVG